jgi:hypothetical protein
VLRGTKEGEIVDKTDYFGGEEGNVIVCKKKNIL